MHGTFFVTSVSGVPVSDFNDDYFDLNDLRNSMKLGG